MEEPSNIRRSQHTSADLLMYSFGMKMRHAASFETTSLHTREQLTICAFEPIRLPYLWCHVACAMLIATMCCRKFHVDIRHNPDQPLEGAIVYFQKVTNVLASIVTPIGDNGIILPVRQLPFLAAAIPAAAWNNRHRKYQT